MSLLSVERPVGLPPTLRCEPSSAGELSGELEREIDQVLGWAQLELDDWQRSFLLDALRANVDEIWSAFEVAGVVPRQNGKGAIQEARQLTGLFVLGETLQIHTAHEFKTCTEHFLRVKGLIEGSDELFRQVKIIRTGAGEQAVELKTGERLRFVARSGRSIRGFSADVVYFDEAFELPVATVGSVLPALSARLNPQVWYFSSAPHFGSEFLHAVLTRAESDDPGRLFLRAWESDPETSPDNREAWARVNPALGIRIDQAFVESEMRTLCSTPEGISEFKRERLGIREGGVAEPGVIPFKTWQKLAIERPAGFKSVFYGLEVAPDASWSAVGSAGVLPNGHLYVDNVRFDRGTSWVLEYIADELYPKRRLPIRIDPSGAAGAFVRPLGDLGVEVVEVSGREYSKACAELLTAVTDGKLRHLGQESLDRSVQLAGKRLIGQEGGWVWMRPSTVDISPLKAATLALSGVEKKRKPRIHVWEQP